MRRSRASRSCAAAVSPSTSCACRVDSATQEMSWTWARPSRPPRGSSIRRLAPTPWRSRCSRLQRLSHVRADEAELQNLLVNLLLNAIQASKPGGKVVVATQGGDAVHIRVIDEGCGIAPEYRQKIFEPFFSLRQGGTGLGLFLSLNAVRSWGGDIVVESTPGKGFYIRSRDPGNPSRPADRRTDYEIPLHPSGR